MFGWMRRLMPLMDEDGGGGGFDSPVEEAGEVVAVEAGTDVAEAGQNESESTAGEPAAEEPAQPVYRTQQEFDEAFERRLVRERKAFERQLRDATSAYEPLTRLMRDYGGIQGETPEELAEGLKKFYAESGIEVPEKLAAPAMPNEDAILLAETKAERFLKEAGLDDIQYEIRRLESLPEKRRTLQDAVMYKRLSAVLNDFRGVAEFKRQYPKTDLNKLLQDQDFSEFIAMTDPSLSIAKKYAKYQALTAKKAETPPSTGSVKQKGAAQDKAYFTPEEVENMTLEEVRKNFDVINESRLKWKGATKGDN